MVSIQHWLSSEGTFNLSTILSTQQKVFEKSVDLKHVPYIVASCCLVAEPLPPKKTQRPLLPLLRNDDSITALITKLQRLVLPPVFPLPEKDILPPLYPFLFPSAPHASPSISASVTSAHTPPYTPIPLSGFQLQTTSPIIPSFPLTIFILILHSNLKQLLQFLYFYPPPDTFCHGRSTG